MSPTFVSILLLSVCALALAPVAIAYWRPRLIPVVGWSYGVMMLGIMVYQAGLLPHSPPVTLQSSVLDNTHLPSGRCAELMEMLERQHVVLNSPDPHRLIVNHDLWSQLPQEARDAIVQCAEASRPAAAGGNAMEVVEQPAR